ncbi:MAG: chorismate mutase [Candidatus Limnocylindrales bacterium]
MAEQEGRRPGDDDIQAARRPRASSARTRPPAAPAESAELRRLRRRIDALDRRIVALLNERARLGLEVGAAKAALGGRGVLDAEREREVLLRVAMANHGPLPQAELLAVYRRLILATRRLELAKRAEVVGGAGGSGRTDRAARAPGAEARAAGRAASAFPASGAPADPRSASDP